MRYAVQIKYKPRSNQSIAVAEASTKLAILPLRPDEPVGIELLVVRLIGTVRQELLDQTFFWNVTDLERKLRKYQEYFNSARVHQGINGNSPDNRYLGVISAKALPQKLKWKSYCGGLFRVPMAA